MDYSYKKETNLSFEDALQKTRESLSCEGFGVITEINVKETFKVKLGIDFEKYFILGACHPASALAVLQEDMDLGLMLPCNIVVYQKSGKIFVATILPTVILNQTGNSNLSNIADNVEQKLRKVIDRV
jgi:uncharacterized protein (DUF302 family)